MRNLLQKILMWAVILAVGASALPLSALSASVPPSIISYQGRLTDNGGNLLGGAGTTYYLKFSIWDSPTVGAGNKIWPTGTVATTTTTVTQGVFTVNIGDTANGYPTPLNLNLTNNSALYLQVEVSSDNNSSETLSPRQQLTSAVFAQVAGAVVGTTTSSLFGTTTPLFSSFVTIQATSSTAIPLSVAGTLGQTANLFQVQNNALQNLFSINSSGALSLAVALTAGNGGTGISTYTPGDITYANSATSLARVASSTGGTILQTSFTTGAPTWVSTSTLGLLASTSISAAAPLSWNSVTGALTITQSSILANGYLSSADYAIFNNKISSSSLPQIFPFTPTTAFGPAANATGTPIGFTAGLYSLASSTIGGGTQITGLTISGGATTTGNMLVLGGTTLAGATSTSLAITGSTTVSGAFNSTFSNWFASSTLNGSTLFANATGTTLFITGSTTHAGAFNSSLANILASSTLSGVTLFANATGTTLALTGSSTIAGFLNAVGGATFGSITVASCAGCSAGGSSFPFTPTTAFGPAANATGTLIGFTGGIYSLASSTIGGGTQITGLTINGGATTTGNLLVSGGTTLAAATSTSLAVTGSSTISNALNSTFANWLASTTLGGSTLFTNATGTTLFITGSTTHAGAFNSSFSNILASSTLAGSALLTNATTTAFAISNISSGSLLKTTAGGSLLAAVAGQDYANFAWPFTPTTAFGPAANATGTLVGFTAGIYSLASSTIGAGTQIGGLSINGGATTTGNAYFAGTVGIGTNNPGAIFDVEKNQNANTFIQIGNTNGSANAQSGVYLTNGTDGFGINMAGIGTVRNAQIYTTGVGGFDFDIINDTADQAWRTGSTLTEKMHLTNAGLLGVGTSSPFAQFTLATLNGSTGSTRNLFLVASSTIQGATTTLFSISNIGLTTLLNLSATSATTSALAVTGSSTISGPFNSVSSNLLASTTLFANTLLTNATSTTFYNNGSSTIAGFLNAVAGATFGSISVSSCSGCGGGGGTFPFTPTAAFGSAANATGTLTGFTAGMYSLASSTIGGGAANSGLTISGGATTTGIAYFANKVGIGTTTPSAKLTIVGGTGVDREQLFDISSSTGAVLFHVMSNGSVGFGTTSPYATLSLDIPASSTNRILFAIASTTNAAGVFSTSTLFSISNTGQVTLLNVSATAATTSALAVTGSTTITGALNAVGGGFLSLTAATTSALSVSASSTIAGAFNSTFANWFASTTLNGSTLFANATGTTLSLTGSSTIVGAFNSTFANFFGSTTLSGKMLFTNATGTTLALTGPLDYRSTAATSTFLIKNATSSWMIASSTGAGDKSSNAIIAISGNQASTTISFFGATSTNLTGAIGSPTASSSRNLLLVGNGVTPASVSIINGGLCVDRDGWCNNKGAGFIAAVGSALTGGSDVAEMYISSSTLGAGDIVASDGLVAIKAAAGDTRHQIIGIVSSNPALTLGPDEAPTGTKAYPIALAGRVPVKVSLDNGPIEIGDRIAISNSTPGVGMKAGLLDGAVAIALEPFASTTATTTSILAFVSLSNYTDAAALASVIASSSATTSEQTLIDGPFAFASDALKQALGSALEALSNLAQTGIRELGAAVHASIGVFDKLFAKEVHTDKLCVGSTCVTQEEFLSMVQASQNNSNNSPPPPSSAPPPADNTPDSGTASTTDEGAP